MIAWTPYSIFALSEQFGDPELITPAIAVLPALIAKSSICYNPLIYVGMNSQVGNQIQNISETFSFIRENVKQFQAAWRRVRGLENPKTPTNETAVNQLSETSSKAYIECSFTSFDKKKKTRPKDSLNQNVDLLDLNKTKLKTINETLTNDQ